MVGTIVIPAFASLALMCRIRRNVKAMKENADPRIIVCEGPTLCPFAGKEAIRASKDGCPLCKHIVINGDETEIEYQRKAH